MNQLPLSARIYATAIVLAAFGVTTSLLARVESLQPSEIVIAFACSGLIAVTTLRPLPLSFKRKLVLDTSALVAAVLLLPAGLAVLVAAIGTLVVHAVRRDDWVEAVFNASQVALEAAAAAVVLEAGSSDLRGDTFDRPATAIVIVIAGMAMYVVTNLVVATMVALQSGMSPLDVWRRVIRQTDRGEIAGQLAQVGLGATIAVSVTTAPWTLPLALLPAIAIYALLGRHIQMRWEAEAALHASAASLNRIERTGRFGRWEWDLTTGIHVWSDEMSRILGAPPGSTPPTFATLLETVHPEDRFAVDTAIHTALSEGVAFVIDHRVRSSDGGASVVHHEGATVLDDAGRKVRLVGTIQDITERKILEAQVEDISARHRAASDLAGARARLGASRELERLRMARELHDGPLQDLIAISYQLARNDRAVATGNGRAVRNPAPEIVRGQVLEVVRQLRSVIGELRPPGLEELGLVAALKGYVESLRWQGDPSLPAIALDADGPLVEVSDALALALFRIAQESIRNAILHADARSICIRLRQEGEEIALEVVDDGRGFVVPARLNELVSGRHFGLVGLAERVDQVNGTLEIQSELGSGTRIAVRLPLVASIAADDHADSFPDRPGEEWPGPGERRRNRSITVGRKHLRRLRSTRRERGQAADRAKRP